MWTVLLLEYNIWVLFTPLVFHHKPCAYFAIFQEMRVAISRWLRCFINLPHILLVSLVCPSYFYRLFHFLFHMTTAIFIMFSTFSFLILPCPDLSFHFLSIPLILLGPLTAQPNYKKFLIFHSLFAHTLSSPLTSLRVPSISLSVSFSADQNYRPSWIRSCFCHCDCNAWYRLIM